MSPWLVGFEVDEEEKQVGEKARARHFFEWSEGPSSSFSPIQSETSGSVMSGLNSECTVGVSIVDEGKGIK